MGNITVHSNNLENITIGRLTARWSARGDRILRYYFDIRHTKLNLHRELSAPEIFILQGKVDALVASWDDKYASFTSRQRVVAGQQSADDLTASAQARLTSIQSILAHTLRVNDAVDWEALKDFSAYAMPTSFRGKRPKLEDMPAPIFATPTISFWSALTGKKGQILEAARQRHAAAVTLWEVNEERKKKAHEDALRTWAQEKDAFWAGHRSAEEAFLGEQAESNASVDRLREAVSEGDAEAVVEHGSMVLEASDYDGLFEKAYELQYDRDKRLMLIGYEMPSPSDMPRIKTVKFTKATGELTDAYIPEREQKANFEAALYQICLRTIHEVFEADSDGNVHQVLFNGYVTAIDPRTGQDVRSCVLSLIVDRTVFEAIDLSRVDPKACFKSLKGVSAASLYALSPVPPIMEMNKEDRRFIEARAIGESVEAGTNLASISWDDFEHLVREVFEQEFRARGGEVKVTRASSDGGVDAIAFDPDPISGGKIVIQAKRYTRTVGVSAVRDLYGTVMNEGASKGILVTTADYGPDAYQFATGKPITLMNGANLLHLMQRHGHRAHIDIRAARAEMANLPA